MRHTTTLHDWPTARATLDRLAAWLKPRLLAGHSYTLTVDEARRTGDQNDKLHAMLQDIARQVEWAGKKWDVEDWKRLLTYAWLRAERQTALIVPAVDGAGFDVLYRRTSRMSKAELSSLIEYVSAWGSERGVQWTDTGD